MTDLNKFGKEIQEIRISKNLSQEDVENLANISSKTISRLENGRVKETSINSIMELSTLYDIDLLSIYLKEKFDDNYLYNEIINSLDSFLNFYSQEMLNLLDKKIDIIIASKLYNKKAYELNLLKLFIRYLRSETYTSNEIEFSLLEEYKKIGKCFKKNKNISKLYSNNIEMRILINICNDFKEIDDYLENEACQRDASRKSYRNGYYNRVYTSKIGTLTLRVPRR